MTRRVLWKTQCKFGWKGNLRPQSLLSKRFTIKICYALYKDYAKWMTISGTTATATRQINRTDRQISEKNKGADIPQQIFLGLYSLWWENGSGLKTCFF